MYAALCQPGRQCTWHAMSCAQQLLSLAHAAVHAQAGPAGELEPGMLNTGNMCVGGCTLSCVHATLQGQSV